jgi:adenosylhomocysteine nucleosidase
MSTSESRCQVAILAPMPSELRPLIRPLSLRRSRSSDGVLFNGGIGRVEVVAALTGIGTQAAARTAQRVLDSTPVHHLIVVGIAGGIGASVDIGDLVVPALIIDLSTGARYRPSVLGDTAPRGTLVTSDELLTDQDELLRLERQGVIAIDMETAAIAAVCERRQRPWSVFRAISDRADDGSIDSGVFGLTGPDGRPNLPALIRFVLTKPGRIPQLARLARGLRLATNAAASAAVHALRKM